MQKAWECSPAPEGQMGKAMLLRKQAAFGSEIAGDDA
jgi:hypothetical protein